jgi:deoxyribodipyrimidine photo-lyase
MKTVFLFGRDLRLQDNEALSYAIEGASEVLPAYIVQSGFSELSSARQHSLAESLRSLSSSLPEGLEIAHGPTVDAIAGLMWFAPEKVVATRSYDPLGMLFQAELAEALFARGIKLELVGSNYAVTPGTIAKDDGGALKVYGAFYKRWMNHGWAKPLELQVNSVAWAEPRNSALPKTTGSAPFHIKAGEEAALATWQRFKAHRLATYAELRNRTDLGGTSHLSHALAHGEIHPRTLLVELGDSEAHDVYRREIAWREFYADVLFRNPHTFDDYYEPRFSEMRYADPVGDARLLEAWKSGNTGYPIVDAAMRQMNQTGWMHNRSRMIVASFLVKDLHFEWMVGARYFEQQLTDFDPASNSHGWQWTAGCGTDASPYFRVFNPVLQGQKFDPKGAYVRKYVPELRHIEGPKIHEPWELIDGYQNGYPERIVDHSKERDESLARLAEIKK